MKIEFKVENQTLTRLDANHLVEKSENYIEMLFYFISQDWKECESIFAIFEDTQADKTYQAIVENNSCKVPNEISQCRSYLVALVGLNGTKKITTNITAIRQVNTAKMANPLEEDYVLTNYSILRKAFKSVDLSINEQNQLVLKLTRNDDKVEERKIQLDFDDVLEDVKYENNSFVFVWNNGKQKSIPFDISNLINTNLLEEKLKTKANVDDVDKIESKINSVQEEVKELKENMPQQKVITLKDTEYEALETKEKDVLYVVLEKGVDYK